MKEEWRDYRRYILHYLWRMPIGIPIALIPFLFNLPRWSKEGSVLAGLGPSLVYGVTIPLAIWFCFAAIYGARTWLGIKSGRKLAVPGWADAPVSAIGLVAGTWMAQTVNHRLYGAPVGGGIFLLSLVFGGIVGMVIFLYSAYQQSKAEAFELRAAVAESRYHVLEQQMRPHFLFNALNSLAELIESGQENAAQTAYKLSDLYRRILASSGSKTAPLSSELEITTAYLELEQLRFGQRLNFEVRAPDDSDGIFLPSLMLQTLVENAIKHGVAPSVEGGQVLIEINQETNNSYRLSVTNTGAHFVQATHNGSSSSTGLANTRARLDLLYGNGHDFGVRTDKQGRTVASFHFKGEKIG
ncbi:MAG: histidine kinase [Blastocatellia bacterium]